MREYSPSYLYCAMIDWIYTNKKGPFAEHSSVLYNVSGVEQWSKIAVGMMKMYEGEVLGKINITQHLLFGEHFPWVSPSSSN